MSSMAVKAFCYRFISFRFPSGHLRRAPYYFDAAAGHYIAGQKVVDKFADSNAGTLAYAHRFYA